MPKKILLSVKKLSTYFHTREGLAKAADGVSFDIPSGKTLAIVGESGCGKSVTSLSIMRLIREPSGHIADGKILFYEKDLLKMPESEMRKIRGNKISIIFQEPMTSLNPVMTVGEQIVEVIRLHRGLSGKEAVKAAVDMLDMVKISDSKSIISEYPHKLSGGMKQRVMIAMALACEPDLLIADEPTTALDVTIQNQILKLMKELQQKKGTSILLITHDMGVVYNMADYIAVMYAGKVVEQSGRDNFFENARHPYTTKLFESLPDRNKRDGKLSTIPGRIPAPTAYPAGCRFAERCHKVFDRCKKEEPLLREIENNHKIACHLENPPSLKSYKNEPDIACTDEANTADSSILISVKGLKVHYPIQKGLLKRVSGHVKAVDGVDLTIEQGETLALVGESGCGKTTTGKGIVRLIPVTEGTVFYKETNLASVTKRQMRKLRSDIQIMFQDPYGSLNPRMMVNQIIAEGLISQKICKNKKDRDLIVKELMVRVGLDPSMMHRYPHEFSGGQRQRIGIARFLAVKPKFVVCDEVTSALDVSVQAQVLNLLKDLQQAEQLSYLFITHNLSVVSYIAKRVAVMYLGRIVEKGAVHEIFDSPKHPYTQALLSASPTIGCDGQEKVYLEGEVPSPVSPPAGCHFHPRCPQAMSICKEKYPGKFTFSVTHSGNCWLHK